METSFYTAWFYCKLTTRREHWTSLYGIISEQSQEPTEHLEQIWIYSGTEMSFLTIPSRWLTPWLKHKVMSLPQNKVNAWCNLNHYCFPQNRKLILQLSEAAKHLADQNLGQQIPCTSTFWLPVRNKFLHLLLLCPGHCAEGNIFDKGTLFFTYHSLGWEAFFSWNQLTSFFIRHYLWINAHRYNFFEYSNSKVWETVSSSCTALGN